MTEYGRPKDLLPLSHIGVDGPWLVIASPGNAVIRLDAHVLDRIAVAKLDLILTVADLEVELHIADGSKAAKGIANHLAAYTRGAPIVLPAVYEDAKRRIRTQGDHKEATASANPAYEHALFVGDDNVSVRGDLLHVGRFAFKISDVRAYAITGGNLPIPTKILLQAALALLVITAELRAPGGEDLALLSKRIAEYEARRAVDRR